MEVFHVFELAGAGMLVAELLPDFLTPQLQVLVWSVVVFFTLLALLWKFAWGPIMHALEEREHRIQHSIDDAAKKQKEAEARLAEYEVRMNAAKDEAAKIIADGKRDVERLKSDIIADANTEAARTLERSKREIALAKDAALVELREKVVGLAAQIATQVIQREVKPEDHSRFITDVMNKIEPSKN